MLLFFRVSWLLGALFFSCNSSFAIGAVCIPRTAAILAQYSRDGIAQLSCHSTPSSNLQFVHQLCTKFMLVLSRYVFSIEQYTTMMSCVFKSDIGVSHSACKCTIPLQHMLVLQLCKAEMDLCQKYINCKQVWQKVFLEGATLFQRHKQPSAEHMVHIGRDTFSISNCGSSWKALA